VHESSVLPGLGAPLGLNSQGRIPIRIVIPYPAFGKYFGYP